jgi:hypothetical protein
MAAKHTQDSVKVRDSRFPIFHPTMRMTMLYKIHQHSNALCFSFGFIGMVAQD